MNHITGIMAMIGGFISLSINNYSGAYVCFGFAFILWVFIAIYEYAEYRKNKGGELACINQLIKDAIDLINRQKSEIKELKEDNFIKSQKRANIFEISKAYGRGETEGIKKYAEEVERRCIERGIYPVIVKNILHNVKEEMTQKPKGEGQNEKHQM